EGSSEDNGRSGLNQAMAEPGVRYLSPNRATTSGWLSGGGGLRKSAGAAGISECLSLWQTSPRFSTVQFFAFPPVSSQPALRQYLAGRCEHILTPDRL